MERVSGYGIGARGGWPVIGCKLLGFLKDRLCQNRKQFNIFILCCLQECIYFLRELLASLMVQSEGSKMKTQ